MIKKYLLGIAAAALIGGTALSASNANAFYAAYSGWANPATGGFTFYHWYPTLAAHTWVGYNAVDLYIGTTQTMSLTNANYKVGALNLCSDGQVSSSGWKNVSGPNDGLGAPWCEILSGGPTLAQGGGGIWH